MKKVLITGATGFIGSSLTRHLHDCNYYIVALSRQAIVNHNEHGYVNEWVQHDLVDDIGKLNNILNNIDYIVHLAGNAHENRQLPYSDFHKINTLSTEKLALAALERSVEKFIYISTIKVNGENTNTSRAFSELSDADPQDNYSKSKYEAEKRIQKVCSSGSMQYVILRPPLVYGAGVRANFLSMIKFVKSGFPLPFASIKNLRSFIYINNLTDAIEKCLISDKVNNNIYLLKDISISLPDLINNLSKEIKSKTVLFRCPVNILFALGKITGRSSSVEKLVSSLEINDRKIRNDLGWKPVVSFEESIRTTVSWFEGGGDIDGT